MTIPTIKLMAAWFGSYPGKKELVNPCMPASLTVLLSHGGKLPWATLGVATEAADDFAANHCPKSAATVVAFL